MQRQNVLTFFLNRNIGKKIDILNKLWNKLYIWRWADKAILKGNCISIVYFSMHFLSLYMALFLICIILFNFLPKRLELQNSPTASLQRGKIPPMSVLNMTLNFTIYQHGHILISCIIPKGSPFPVSLLLYFLAQSAGAVEYTDWISAEE